ncbi:MAG: McrC family protein [Synergistaceae bacterium]|jgi:5-methylcytosine-specific restriction endonuclease McrBC regulatory subunit McrC|nr:McrC family protein [Synergistaceae bacterium]
MRITDNTRVKLSELGDNPLREIANSPLREIADVPLEKLAKNNPNLLVPPANWKEHGDAIPNTPIFSLSANGELTTGNIMGFIGVGDTTLTIASRFHSDKSDYFLHYMLGKVNKINVVNLDTRHGSEGIRDFLPYLFPAYLKKALSQGIYRRYATAEYNDANIKGPIDLPRHIRVNVPFAGRVAYRAREHQADNSVTQLIRHTIEHLKSSSFASAALCSDADTKANVQKVIAYTPRYAKAERRRVVGENLRPVSHPYFTEYRPLQALCLQILRHEKLTFGDKDKVHGLLFDGAWLWEEYLNEVLKTKIEALGLELRHPKNKTGEGGEHLFIDGQTIYPDFRIVERGRSGKTLVVADAKYKKYKDRAAREDYYPEDYYQVITYMHRYDCKTGVILFPFPSDSGDIYSRERVVKNAAQKDCVVELGLRIPRAGDFVGFVGFRNEMEKAEGEVAEALRQALPPPYASISISRKSLPGMANPSASNAALVSLAVSRARDSGISSRMLASASSNVCPSEKHESSSGQTTV